LGANATTCRRQAIIYVGIFILPPTYPPIPHTQPTHPPIPLKRDNHPPRAFRLYKIFGFKKTMRYFDFCGNVLDAWGKTGGQQGDPLEMIVFCPSIHHPWGRTLAKHYQDACAVAYADYGYIKAKLSVALEVLSDIKHVLREDTGLDINDKTKILVKGISSAEAHTAAQRLLTADPSLALLGPLLAPKAFVDDGYIDLGVPIGTDAFVQHFVKKKCQELAQGGVADSSGGVADSTLRVEMNGLEEQADNAKASELFWKPFSLMARHHQAHIRQRCLRPSDLGDFCIHNTFGGPHPCSPPPSP
jgi:hypothetical protein